MNHQYVDLNRQCVDLIKLDNIVNYLCSIVTTLVILQNFQLRAMAPRRLPKPQQTWRGEPRLRARGARTS